MEGRSIIPRNASGNVERFLGGMQTAAVTATGWIPWTRPRWSTMHLFIAVGGGSGGGGGAMGVAGSIRGGGGGGGSGGIARLLIPSFYLPRRLWLLPGNACAGGTGATSNGVGGSQPNGNRTNICDKPSVYNVAADLLLQSSSSSANGGSGGDVTTGGGSAGTGEILAVNTGGIYIGFGDWKVIGGQDGTAGSAGGGGGASGIILGSNGIPLSGGAGGGTLLATNLNDNGGPITGAGRFPSIAGGVGGATGAAGGAGYPIGAWGGTGGAGGGTGTTGAGGIGGCGAPGCGGGGGGGGTGAGGDGGNGGPGFIIILSW